jgi:ABC-type antimicrobial peptide transport system permease subunit
MKSNTDRVYRTLYGIGIIILSGLYGLTFAGDFMLMMLLHNITSNMTISIIRAITAFVVFTIIYVGSLVILTRRYKRNEPLIK